MPHLALLREALLAILTWVIIERILLHDNPTTKFQTKLTLISANRIKLTIVRPIVQSL
jgi:hypothetical protein